VVYPVTLIPGDGIGPEVTEAARRVLDATGIGFDWRVVNAGEAALAEHGELLPEAALASIRQTRVALKGPITTPVGKGFRSVNVGLRQALNLYANLRPARTYAGVRSRYEQIDLVVVRENMEDLYAGVEFQHDTDEARQVIAGINAHSSKQIDPSAAISIKMITAAASRRIVTFAFDYAHANGRRLVSAVHKANIMKFSDGLFLETARQVATEYPKIQFNDVIVDNMCMQLVQKPDLYDVLVLPNLYGDIISDLCAGLVGGLGVTPGANIGADYAVFEPIHGSAPKYAGQNKANPVATILSGVMLLRHLGERAAAEQVDAAVAAVIAEGAEVTYDLKPTRDDPTAVGTSQMADAIIRRLG
jgi:isocitrate dehydrogenase (NAD+)